MNETTPLEVIDPNVYQLFFWLSQLILTVLELFADSVNE